MPLTRPVWSEPHTTSSWTILGMGQWLCLLPIHSYHLPFMFISVVGIPIMADTPAEAFIINLVKLIFSYALTFLTPSQRNLIVSLCSSQIACLYLHWLCICFLCLSLTSSAWFIHISLLTSFDGILQMRIESCCSLWKVFLRICQLCSAFLFQRAVSQKAL